MGLSKVSSGISGVRCEGGIDDMGGWSPVRGFRFPGCGWVYERNRGRGPGSGGRGYQVWGLRRWRQAARAARAKPPGRQGGGAGAGPQRDITGPIPITVLYYYIIYPSIRLSCLNVGRYAPLLITWLSVTPFGLAGLVGPRLAHRRGPQGRAGPPLRR